MRIIQLITELRPAGAERIVQTLSCGLVAAGHEVAVVALRPLPPSSFVVDRLLAAGIAVRSLGLTMATPWRSARIRRILREFKPDIVHAHLIHANLLSRVFKYPAAAVANTIHIAERRPGKWWHFMLDRLTMRRCEQLTAVSRAVAQFHADKLGVDVGSIPVVYNGIEPPAQLIATEKLQLRREWGVADCAKVIGSVGRLDWQKGYDQFLRILPELETCIPDDERWGVVIIGEGPERQRLEQQIPALTLSRIDVRLPGFRPDADRAMGAFDLFVMPSRYEGFGLTLLEAMCHGLPVVASGVDSLPELLEGYSRGTNVDFSEENLAAAAETIFSVANNGYSRNEQKSIHPGEKYHLGKMITGYLSLYGDALKTKQ